METNSRGIVRNDVIVRLKEIIFEKIFFFHQILLEIADFMKIHTGDADLLYFAQFDGCKKNFLLKLRREISSG